jgi:hypothetical protein
MPRRSIAAKPCSIDARRAAALAAAALACVAAAASVGCGSRREPPAAAAVLAATPATPVETGDPVYPLKAGPTGRYLVDQRNRPFLIVGDSPQALVINASEAEADRFLSDRAAAGFNSVWVNLLSAEYTGGRPDGSTTDGIRPFRVDGDLSTPNAAYFARADAIIRGAAKHGIAVFLDPIETGSWLTVLRRNGVEKAYAYGRFLGEHYRDLPNIVWFSGNDLQTWRNARDDALVLAVARGIRSVDHVHIHTVELNFLASGSLDDDRWKGMVELDAAYTYFPTYAEVLKEYSRRDALPVFMVEANYEGEHWYTGPETLRRQEYWSLLSGAAGQFYGNKYTWPLVKGWQRHLDTVGSREMTYVTNLFATLRWFDLVPDSDHRVLVFGYGWFKSQGSVNDSDYVTAAATRDGKLAVAYLPTSRPVAIELSKLSGPVRAQWYDPTAGTYVPVAGAPFASSGIRNFSSPGRNHAGDEDWVLVLRGT